MTKMDKGNLKPLDFSKALELYKNKLQERIDDYHNDKHMHSSLNKKVVLDYGRKYVRVWLESASGSKTAHSFIEIKSGNVLACATWKAPVTKNPRSNIYADDSGMSGVNVFGANYIKGPNICPDY